MCFHRKKIIFANTILISILLVIPGTSYGWKYFNPYFWCKFLTGVMAVQGVVDQSRFIHKNHENNNPEMERHKIINSFGYAILQSASLNGYSWTVEFLLDNGVKPDYRFSPEWPDVTIDNLVLVTVWHAIMPNHLPYKGKLGWFFLPGVIDSTLSFLHSLVANDKTPLWLASLESHEPVVALLLSHNADPNIVNTNGATALYAASFDGHEPVIALLLNHNADPNIALNGTTPLFVASEKGHEPVVALLLNHNADPNIANKDGQTPLYVASDYGRKPVVALLLSHNADPNIANTNGATPLYVASQNGHQSVVALLLNNHNTDPNIARKDGSTPLYVASQNGYEPLVTLLLSHSYDPNIAGKDDNATLFYAAYQYDHKAVIQLFPKDQKNDQKDQESLILSPTNP